MVFIMIYIANDMKDNIGSNFLEDENLHVVPFKQGIKLARCKKLKDKSYLIPNIFK